MININPDYFYDKKTPEFEILLDTVRQKYRLLSTTVPRIVAIKKTKEAYEMKTNEGYIIKRYLQHCDVI